MLKKFSTYWTLLVGLAMLLSACRPSTPETPTATTMDANAVFTAAAETAGAMMTEIAAQTPTPLPATPTETPAPPTATLAPTATQSPAASPTSGLGATADNSEFTGETVPDGTDFAPGQTFVKTWKLKNNGTSTWTTAYSFVFIDGSQMGGQASLPLNSQVAPGQTVDLAVNLTAPSTAGTHTGYWKMKNATGQLFGTAVWVTIDVGGAGTPGTPTQTTTPGQAGTPGSPSPTVSPTPGGSSVANVTLMVDNANFSGQCPHTFTFTGQFTLSQAATVTYQLEANTGFALTLPDPVTMDFPAGTHNVGPFALDFSNSFSNAWARLRITAPVDVSSNQLTFSLTCQ